MTALIIAKVGDRYRNLTGVEVAKDWIDMGHILTWASSLVAILRTPQNSMPLEHEVRWADTLEENAWELQNSCHKQFPFITTCLAIAFWKSNDRGATAINLKYLSTARIHSYKDFTRSAQVAVIDVTELSKLRYCSIQAGIGIVSASQIASIHHDTTGASGTFANLDLLNCHDLGYILGGPWELGFKNDDGLELAQSVPNAPVPTLRSLAMEATVELVFDIQHGELPKLIKSLELMPDFRSILRSKCYSKPELSIGSQTVGQLLQFALADDETLDLSLFSLAETQLAEIVCRSDDRNTDITTLSIAGNQDIRGHLLEQLLARNTRLHTLYLLDTPQISLGTKLDLVRQSNVTELFDSELFAHAFEYESPISDHFPSSRLSTKYIRPPLIQMRLVISRGPVTPRFAGGVVDIEAMTEDFNCSDKTRSIERQAVHILPFSSTNKPPLAFFSGLSSFLKDTVVSYRRLGSWESRNIHLSRSLAMHLATSFEQAEDSSHRVGALPPDLFRYGDLRCKDGRRRRLPEKIKEGEWTFMLVIDESDQDIYGDPICRYAFVTAAPASRPTKRRKTTHDADCVDGEALPKWIQNVTIASIGTYLDNIMPGEEEDLKKARQSIHDSWRSALWRLTEERYRRPGRRAGERRVFRRPKLCSRDEVESWLKSSDFDEVGRVQSWLRSSDGDEAERQ